MESEARVRGAEVVTPPTDVLAPGASVVLLRPRRLRGTVGIVQRRLAAGWEVEVRTPLGLPMHLTVPERALRPR